jgi:sigma-B regulation protein RsbQ
VGVGEYLHQHLAGSTLRFLDVAGHCAHMSHPDLVIGAMQGYLD